MYKNKLFEFLIFFSLASFTHGEVTERKVEDISKDGRFILGWTIDLTNRKITFDVKANISTVGNGYIGLGFNSYALMDGADLVLTGITEDGRSYITDFHSAGIGGQSPIDDGSQDYTLESIETSEDITLVTFSRKLDTGDYEADREIKNENIYVLWSLGNNHYVQAHEPENRGSFALNFMSGNSAGGNYQHNTLIIVSAFILALILISN